MTESAGSAIIRNTAAGSVKTVLGTSLPAPITLVVAGGSFNVQTATCGSDCVTCCGLSKPFINPSNFYCPVGASMQCTFEATDCNGNVAYPSCTWRSTDTSVMTVDLNGAVRGAVPGVQKELLRHLNIPTTMNICTLPMSRARRG